MDAMSESSAMAYTSPPPVTHMRPRYHGISGGGAAALALQPMKNKGDCDGMGNPRRSNGHRRSQVVRMVRSWGRPCAICGRPIDYSLPPGDPWCFEVDEIVPVSKGGSPLDPGNVQPTHRRCNQWRSNRSMSDVRAIIDGHGGRDVRGVPPKPTTEW